MDIDHVCQHSRRKDDDVDEFGDPTGQCDDHIDAMEQDLSFGTAYMDTLPNEILCAIFSLVPCVERILVVSRVCRHWHDLVNDAGDRNDPVCVTRTVATFRRSRATVCNRVARSGHLNCLVRAVARGFQVDKTVTEAAARAGSLECLRYLHSMACPWDANAAAAAARSGSLACLRYLCENGCPWDYRATEEAALKGHLDCLRYAHQKGCVLTRDAAAYAAQRGNAACLDYILTNDSAMRSRLRLIGVYGTQCMAIMERFGLANVEVKQRWLDDAAIVSPNDLAYLLARGVEPTIETCKCAVMGTLDTLRLLVGAGRAWDTDLCAYAAKIDRLDALSFLRAHGYAWDERTCAAAVAGRSLDCLRYAHENGCPWDHRIWEAVQAYTDPAIVAYLVEHNCPRPPPNAHEHVAMALDPIRA